MLDRRNLPAVFKALKEYIDTYRIQTGMVVLWGGSGVPTGFYLCDGSVKSTATDTALFGVIGYTYGGSGASFVLPTQAAATSGLTYIIKR